MGRLIDDLLAFSRLSRQPIKPQPVAVAALVQEILPALRAQARQDSRAIEIRIGELPPCQGDPSLLRQVWWNLIENALKYTRRCEQTLIDIGSEQSRDGITYHVRDNGVGFDMRHARKLFGVFQRLHRAEEYEGSGVGLAIVQRIVQRHGGCIWAEAQPDRGAAFFFTVAEGARAATDPLSGSGLE